MNMQYSYRSVKNFTGEAYLMPTTIEATAIAHAPKEIVWKVLADFPNIVDYTDTVKASASTSEQAFGVGASRHCDLAPIGTTEEKIIDFTPGDKLVISLYKTTGMPVKNSETTFSLTEIDANTTQLTMTAEVQAKGGIFAGFIAKRLKSRLPKGAGRTVKDLAASAERIAQATAA